MTIAPWDYETYIPDADNNTLYKDYLKHMRLAVVGQIGCWHSQIHSINYTLSHHTETSESRSWDDLLGRLCAYTGEAGGNHHGDEMNDWKHGIHNHALSKIELCTDPESVAWAGIC